MSKQKELLKVVETIVKEFPDLTYENIELGNSGCNVGKINIVDRDIIVYSFVYIFQAEHYSIFVQGDDGDICEEYHQIKNDDIAIQKRIVIGMTEDLRYATRVGSR